jgi:hypothetical protein
MQLTTWTIHRAAVEFGASRETITRGLRTNGVEVEAGKEFTTRQIFTALAGDLKFERCRRERAQALKIELENKVTEGRLLDVAAIEKRLWTDFLQPLRGELLNLPSQISPLCHDPSSTQAALTTWTASMLARLRAPQPAPETPAQSAAPEN